MTEAKKGLYRELLYWAMVDARLHSSSATANPLHLVLCRRRSHREVLQFINALTNWLHNTALFAATDFSGFEEKQFWQDYNYFRTRFPADRWAGLTETIIIKIRALRN